MIIKKIQTNETVKFRVPAEVAGQIRRIEAQCKNLGHIQPFGFEAESEQYIPCCLVNYYRSNV